VKIYFYDAETGVYQGEAFETEWLTSHPEGITTVPPPAYQPGHIPVFDQQKAHWTVVSIKELPMAANPRHE
jgi:hypothetical protein